MLLNNWYPAGRATEIGATPYKTRMLGLDFVLFRDATGKAHCLSDVCCHRGAALHTGQVNVSEAHGACIACPYHGWEFNTAGACVKIPALGEEISIPKRARIDSYPVTEKYGLVFVFLGDAPEEDRPAIPDWFEPFYSASDRRLVTYEYTYTEVNWARLGENSVDTSHPSFVHKQFGNRLSPKANIVPITEEQYGATVSRTRAAPPLSGKSAAMQKLLPADRKTTRVTLHFSMVGLTEMLYQEMTPEISQVLFSSRVPVDEFTTKSYGFQARNFLLEPEQDEERLKGLMQAAVEDHDIVRLVKPKFTPKSTTDEFLIESDGMELMFRRKAQEWARTRGALDGAALAAQEQEKVAVIPSPARRIDPKGWVHPAVPMLQTTADVKAAE